MKFKTILKKCIFPLLVVAVILISSILPCFATDDEIVDSARNSLEVGRTVTTNYQFINGDDIVNGFRANGNNLKNATHAYYVEEFSYLNSNYWTINSEQNSNSSILDFPYDKYYIKSYSGSTGSSKITVTLSDFYIHCGSGASSVDNIYLGFVANKDIFTTICFCSYELSYIDLLHPNSDGSYDPIIEKGEFIPSLDSDSGTHISDEYMIYDFIGDPLFDECLYYFDYITISFDSNNYTGEALNEYDLAISVKYDLQPYAEFDFNDTTYKLTTQSEYDDFRAFMINDGVFVEPPSTYLRNYTQWVATALGGFFSVQLFPGFYFGGILVVIIAFALVMWWLKMFGGG